MILRPIPRLVSPVWGGFALARDFAKGDDPSARIGEAWEVWADNTTVGGGRLGDLVHLPLLVKLLDTREALSVQVHPDDTAAARLEGAPSGKAEGWVVLHAEPGARVAYGLTRAMSAEELRERALSGAIEEDLAWLPVHAGDVIDVPPGTIHAIGGGLTLYEIQQPSDLTYRLYDYRRGRELHLDKAVDVAIRAPIRPQARRVALGEGRAELLRSPHFVVEERETSTPRRVTVDSPTAVTVADGALLVAGEPVGRGETVVVLPGSVEIEGPARSLWGRVPA